jgi:hypothetical protein
LPEYLPVRRLAVEELDHRHRRLLRAPRAATSPCSNLALIWIGPICQALGNWQVRVEILVSDFEKITLEDKIGLSR